MREPIEKWTKPDKDGVSILEKFYKDKEKYTFSFQVYVLLTIIDAVKDIVKTNPACNNLRTVSVRKQIRVRRHAARRKRVRHHPIRYLL
jgi:deoxyadenosine/deoxycytidine kinase